MLCPDLIQIIKSFFKPHDIILITSMANNGNLEKLKSLPTFAQEKNAVRIAKCATRHYHDHVLKWMITKWNTTSSATCYIQKKDYDTIMWLLENKCFFRK